MPRTNTEPLDQDSDEDDDTSPASVQPGVDAALSARRSWVQVPYAGPKSEVNVMKNVEHTIEINPIREEAAAAA